MIEEQQTEAAEGVEETGEGGQNHDSGAEAKDLQRQLAKAQATITRLEGIAEKHGKNLEAQKAAKIKEAEKQGEWQQLHGDVKAELASTVKELETARKQIASRDDFFAKQVDDGLASIDKQALKDLEPLLSKLDPMDKLQAIQGFQKATGAQTPAAPAAKRGGKPGPAKKAEMTEAEKSRNTKAAKDQRLADTLAKLSELGIN